MTEKATYAADVPLICDPVPGRLVVITCDKPLTREQVHRLRYAWDEGQRTGVIVLDAGLHIQVIGAAQWPDAEFCAA
jgi:hypothetical protein